MYQEAVKKVYAERKDFIIIGLTGGTGSGCTYVSEMLNSDFDKLTLQIPQRQIKKEMSLEERQYDILYKYATCNWKSFRVIQMKHVILTFVLEEDYAALEEYAKPYGIEFNCDFKAVYNEMHRKRMEYYEKVSTLTSSGEAVPDDEGMYQYYFYEVPELYDKMEVLISKDKYNKFMRSIGDNIRSSGKAFDSVIDAKNFTRLSERVNFYIKMLRRRNIRTKEGVRVVIDAIRTPFEASFFKDRYSAFYLFGIMADKKTRRDRLSLARGLKRETIEEIEQIEYPSLNRKKGINQVDKEGFFKINIEKTLEHVDVLIKNENRDDTAMQLIRYVSLIMHPGIVSPTQVERCMQLAHDAKMNSGCLSRQVGAAITDNEYNLLSIGWNSAPRNQVPCNLRNVSKFIEKDHSDDIAFSSFENDDVPFCEYICKQYNGIDEKTLEGRNCSYCFKDVYNGMMGTNNQVYTRSIHAEEMAFLRVSSVLGGSMNGGYLFVTASPCELCSKKACHVGIKKIYYIDKYPGIAYENIINNGREHPIMEQYYGSVGMAYDKLYKQIFPYKDELNMLLDFQKQ